MAVTPANQLRHRKIMLSRSFKELFASAIPRGRIYNWLFRGENGELRMVGEHVLADLREFCGLESGTIFDTDPLMMARREGRREVAMRIINLLNLDEAAVQQLMRLDDGLSEF
jgi:hypothetical protein